MNAESGKPETSTTVPDEPVSAGLGRLLLVFLVATVLVFAVSIVVWDLTTALVALLSAAVCMVAAVAGHFCSIFPRGDVFRLARLYQSMTVRIALPVLLLFVCKNSFPDVFSRGMVYFVFLFYLVGLLTEVTVQAKRLKVLKSSAEPVLGSTASGESQAG